MTRSQGQGSAVAGRVRPGAGGESRLRNLSQAQNDQLGVKRSRTFYT